MKKPNRLFRVRACACSAALLVAAAVSAADIAQAAEPDADEPLSEAVRPSRQGLGLDPGALNFGGLVLPPPPGAQANAARRKAGMNFHGFLRAPMRIGIGSGDDVPPGGPSGTKLHSPPRVPDAQYTEWQYTNELGGPWTEMQFSYGNAKVFGTVALAAYNQSDAGFRDFVAQLGINQAWVTFNLNDLFGDRGGLLINVGSFSGGYGSMGRYDAGAYGTYLFGRTHATGETISFFYDLSPSLTLQLEHGIGVRLDVAPRETGVPQSSLLPYPGPVQQFPTLLHHGHVGFTYRDKFRIGLHGLTAWTQSSTRPNEPDGRITSLGGELKMIDTRLGSAFFGVGYLRAKESTRVAGAFEALHSWEGWSFADNFFRNSGTGKILSVAGEWTLSWATLLGRGGGPDVVTRVFGLYNQISEADITAPPGKLKLGSAVTYLPARWLGVSARYDNVQPNMNDNTETFHVLSPRLLFRSDWFSNEEIVLQYTHYWLGRHTKLGDPWDRTPGTTADKRVLSIIATMWW
jgi:hypothetical protein